MQIELPTCELEAGEHPRHVDDSDAPTAVEYVSASHALHASDPVDALYAPASHAVQLSPSGPEYPALQVQIVPPSGELESGKQPRHVNAPESVEYVPASHALHAYDPVDVLYAPASHAVHVPPSGPE